MQILHGTENVKYKCILMNMQYCNTFTLVRRSAAHDFRFGWSRSFLINITLTLKLWESLTHVIKTIKNSCRKAILSMIEYFKNHSFLILPKYCDSQRLLKLYFVQAHIFSYIYLLYFNEFRLELNLKENKSPIQTFFINILFQSKG
jgi:hypothetical protein